MDPDGTRSTRQGGPWAADKAAVVTYRLRTHQGTADKLRKAVNAHVS